MFRLTSHLVSLSIVELLQGVSDGSLTGVHHELTHLPAPHRRVQVHVIHSTAHRANLVFGQFINDEPLVEKRINDNKSEKNSGEKRERSHFWDTSNLLTNPPVRPLHFDRRCCCCSTAPGTGIWRHSARVARCWSPSCVSPFVCATWHRVNRAKASHPSTTVQLPDVRNEKCEVGGGGGGGCQWSWKSFKSHD